MTESALYEKPMPMDNMAPAARGPQTISPGKAMMLPGVFITGLAALSRHTGLGGVAGRSMLVVAGLLLLATIALFVSASRSGRTFVVEVMLFKHHWVQALTQVVIYGFWAWYVPDIRMYWPLLLAQLLFAYTFHILLTWSRRDHYGLGFGPVPITGSFNLFILFRPDWFYWQFGIVAAAFLGKEFIRWEKDGRSAHIFNPSSFGLVVFSAILILTGTTDLTFGVEIASWLTFSPNVYLVLFVVSIPVQLYFGVATMTVTAFVTTYVVGLAYFVLTGTYFFFDSYIPVAVFVGMLLLITDPATAPRSESGRLVFGVMYGLGLMIAFEVLRMADLPAFYDKLLPVPILNLFVRKIDRAAEAGALKFADFSGFGPSLSGGQRRAVTVGLWAVAFISIAAAGGVGDKHRGQWVPFWQETCEAGSDRACDHLLVLEQNLCLNGSGWACNELGILLTALEDDPGEIRGALNQGCAAGFPEACANAERAATGGGGLVSAAPPAGELPDLLRGNKGPVTERDAAVNYALACERGFRGTCEGSGT
ncbi:MAG: hypothetical protein HN396_06575 [Gemmatimonadales bacterium]|jgi:hypothetical protein|nr:hypothetical protein [Gemmatimonadales bacterium]MBT3499909.1 hypothetical protein [Gemmatimonadales bacterium]MBT3774296.1 hypothetical protein [Gemmatimonadales bacterium]MBT3957870.1 hypothetical protein [Gemmatimonadales bacterium]MBT4186271.1 hypothetical protein [Gemmatimonadales bacterium]